MTEQAPTLIRHDLEAKIVKHCWEDEEFRKEFTADPAGAFGKYLRIPAMDVPKIVVHEESAGSWHIVLPAKPANADELSEQDIESVAGGGITKLAASLKAATVINLTVSGVATAAISASASADAGW
jgi:hypothetical protein